MQDRKVLFVIPYMYEGGAQRALSNIQARLGDTYRMDTVVNSEINRAYPNKGNVISLNIQAKPRTGSVFFQFYAFVKRVCVLKKLKKNGDYIACVSFIDSANVANILSGNKHTRTIVSIRTSYEAKRNIPQYKYIVRPLARMLYNKADAIVAVSEELKSELEKEIKPDPGRLIAITNGFDQKSINEQAKEGISEEISETIRGRKVILTAGRLNPAKHQWHLIRAFSQVIKTVDDAVLVIAGSGELEQYLKKLANSLGILEKVLFLGFAKNVYQYMKAADVFVLPSGCEGFPNVLGEALCVGTPCIATDFRTGAREILAPQLLGGETVINNVSDCEYGILCPVCSGTRYDGNEPLEWQETELANAMIRMINDAELNSVYRSRSLKRAEELDIQSVVNKWIRTIEDKDGI